MAQLATTDDFEGRHGQADDRVDALLEDASALILSEVTGADVDWVTEPDSVDAPSVVVAICVEVAYRAWSNPGALSSESLGEYTQAWQNRSGEVLYLTKAEKRLLRKAAQVSGIMSIAVETPYSESDEITSISDNDFAPLEEGEEGS